VRAAVVTSAGEAPAYGVHADPEPLPGTTLVRVTAAPVVPLDLLCASGTSYFGRPAVPYVPGVQGVGVVERSASLPAGTRIWFATNAGMAPGDGSLAEQCRVPDDDVVPVAADVVVDPVFGVAATAASQVLAAGGRLVNLGGASGDTAEFSSAVLRSRSAEVLGYTNNALTPAQRATAVTAVAEHAAAGRMAVAHEVLPLAEAATAWERQATGDVGVRLVLTP
jgi:NADPH:quinone reductase-like Zn-dependent oxidoreductase